MIMIIIINVLCARVTWLRLFFKWFVTGCWDEKKTLTVPRKKWAWFSENQSKGLGWDRFLLCYRLKSLEKCNIYNQDLVVLDYFILVKKHYDLSSNRLLPVVAARTSLQSLSQWGSFPTARDESMWPNVSWMSEHSFLSVSRSSIPNRTPSKPVSVMFRSGKWWNDQIKRCVAQPSVGSF